MEGFSDAIGLAVDNASLVAHQVLDRIVNHPACGESTATILSIHSLHLYKIILVVSSRDFASKEGRASWEKEFCNHFFQPVMQVPGVSHVWIFVLNCIHSKGCLH